MKANKVKAYCYNCDKKFKIKPSNYNDDSYIECPKCKIKDFEPHYDKQFKFVGINA